MIINSTGCQIESMEPRGNVKVLRGTVPLSEMFGYATTVRSLSQGRASIQGFHRTAAEGPETHRRDMKEARIIRLTTVRSADADAKILRVHLRREESMMNAFKTGRIHVMPRTKGDSIPLAFGATIDERTFFTIDR